MKLFEQSTPVLHNAYTQDPYLKPWLQCYAPDHVETWQEPLHYMGDLSANELYVLQQADRLNEPELTQWSPWGQRIDHIELTPLWKRAEVIAAETGLVAIPYENNYGDNSRLLQFSLVYLFTPSSDIYSCPLAMTDGAATALKQSGNQELIERALPHLTSRDPQRFWTSGQWMTELPGGSDVSRTETLAYPPAPETAETPEKTAPWTLQGRKWFTSATTSQMALALARPVHNQHIKGSKGLALFYLEPRDREGRLQNISVNRLKDKMGTRKVPTAELLLTGAPAHLVAGETVGVKHIAPMLNITRTWNAVSSIALMRRGLNLAWDYAAKREAFGKPLIQKPLHRETLLQLEAEFAGAFAFTMYCVQLLGKWENKTASAEEERWLRLYIPLLKLITAKQSVRVLSEVIESFGGAGYVEDTGLPQLLRDAQVFPIWEGTTNVLSLDALHVLIKSQQFAAADWIDGAYFGADAKQHLDNAFALLREHLSNPDMLESQARTIALKLSRGLETVCLQHFAQRQPTVTLAAMSGADFEVALQDLITRLTAYNT